MSDTIKDYLIGFGFDVDEGGASQIESMLKDLDGIVRNLGDVLTQATEKVQGFMTDLQQQSEAASKSAGDVDQLAQNTQRFTSEANGGSNAASTFSNFLYRLGQSARESKDKLRETNQEIKDAGKSSRESASSVDGFSKALSKARRLIKMVAGAAVVKKFVSIIKALYEFDQNLAQTEKSLNKTTEEARAHTLALQAMGKTYEEIKKDKNLQATYDELVALGESMALPGSETGIDNVRSMVDSFQKLKLVGSYSMQWLYHAIQTVAEGPLRRFKEIIDDVTGGFKANLPKLSIAGAHIIDGVLRIVSALTKGAMAIVKFLNKIPGPIKVIAALIAALGIALKAGPLGKVAIALALIGALLDDLYTYLEGGESLFGNFWGWAVPAFEKVKEAVSDAVDAVKSFWDASKNEDGKVNWIGFGVKLASWIITGAKLLLGRFGSLLKGWITGNEDAGWDEVGTAIGEKMVAAIKAAINLGTDILGALFGVINGAITSEGIAGLFTGAADFVQGLFDAINDSLTGETTGGLVQTFLTGITTLFNTITSSEVTTAVGDFASTLITGLGTAIGSGLDGAGNIISGIAEMLRTALSDGNIGDMLGNLGDMGAQIIAAIGKGIKNAAGGAASLIGAIGEMISAALSKGANGESIIGDLSGLGQTILTAIIQAIGDVANGATQIFNAVAGLFDGVSWASVGIDLGNLATGLISKLAEAFSGEGINVDGLMEAIGNAINAAADAAGTTLGAVAGKIVGYIFSAEGLTSIYNVAKSVGEMLIKGIAEGITGMGNFVLSTIEGVLIGLGLADEDTFENMRETGVKLTETLNEGIEQGLLETDGPEIDFARWAKYRVGDNDPNLDAAAQDYVSSLNSAILGAASNSATGEEFRNQILQSLITDPSEPIIELNPEDWFTVDDSGNIDWTKILGNHGLTPEDILPDFNDLDFWGSLMQAVQSGDNSQMGEVINQKIAESISGGEGVEQAAEAVGDALETALEEKGTNAVDEAMAAINEELGQGADGLSIEGIEAPLDSVDVVEGDGAGIQEATQDAIDNVLANQEFSADVTVKTNVTVEVEDSNAEAIGTELGTAIGSNMSDLIQQSVDSTINKIKSLFNTVPASAKSAFSRAASGIRSALSSLPTWVQTNIVNKINQALANIKVPNIKMPSVGGHSEGGVVDKETVSKLGEGNKREYVIPVTKPNRGIPLLKRAAADMGLTVQSYANASKMLGGSGGAGVTPAYAAAAATGSTTVNNKSEVNAPATINVYGSNARQTAELIEQNQEQRLLRNIRTALA